LENKRLTEDIFFYFIHRGWSLFVLEEKFYTRDWSTSNCWRGKR